MKTLRQHTSPLALRTEAELTDYFEGQGNTAPSMFDVILRRGLYEPIVRPSDLRCGPVFVKNPDPPVIFLSDEMSEAEIAAAERLRRVGLQLQLADARHERRSRSGEPPSTLLELFFGDRVRAYLQPLGKYGNLIPHTTAAAQAHRASRSTRDLDEWLQRLGEKITSRKQGPGERASLLALAKLLNNAGEDLLIASARAYEDAARELPARARRRPPPSR